MQINYFNMKLIWLRLRFQNINSLYLLSNQWSHCNLGLINPLYFLIIIISYWPFIISCLSHVFLLLYIGTISWFNSSLDWSVRKSLVTSSHMETMYNSYTISNEIYLILSIMMSFLKFYYQYIWICIIFASQGFLGSNLSTVTVYIHFEDIKLISPIHLPVSE